MLRTRKARLAPGPGQGGAGSTAAGSTAKAPPAKAVALPDLSGTWTTNGLFEVRSPSLHASSTITRSKKGKGYSFERQVEIKTRDKIRSIGKGSMKGTVKVVNGQLCTEVTDGSIAVEDWATGLPVAQQLQDLFAGGYGKLGCADVASATPTEVSFRRGVVMWKETKAN